MGGGQVGGRRVVGGQVSGWGGMGWGGVGVGRRVPLVNHASGDSRRILRGRNLRGEQECLQRRRGLCSVRATRFVIYHMLEITPALTARTDVTLFEGFSRLGRERPGRDAQSKRLGGRWRTGAAGALQREGRGVL